MSDTPRTGERPALPAAPTPQTPVIASPAARDRPPAPAGTPSPAWVQQTVYEDEHVVMEWSVRTPAADTVAVTFDPILVDASRPAYAANFLHKAGIDTLCVRKKSEHFYQPLTRERFDEVARPVLARYRRRLAYGSSLGAYAVLYFCAHGFETVISSSPRVSAHPRFGRPHWQERAPFMHAYFDPDKPATSGAVVFYDPHDAMDRCFVDEELRPAWPRGVFVSVPYAGHPANQFLSEIGYISPFVQAIVAGRTPPALDRRGTKARSFTYRHVLAAACLRHGKPRWAESLCQQALAMKPDLVDVKLTLGQALVKLGRPDEAEPLLLAFQQKYPQDGDARHALHTIERARATAQLKNVLPAAAEQLQRLKPKARGTWTAWRGRPALAMLWLTGRLRLSVSREDIEWCYRHLLGRRAESVQALLAHRRCRHLEPLVRAIVGSPEFAGKAARAVTEPERERLVGMAVIARRVLPADGRMADFSAGGCFGPSAGPHEAGLDLGLNSEPVAAAAPDSAHLVQAMARALKPGGHVLLATRGVPDGEPPDTARPPVDARGLLQANGLDVVEDLRLADHTRLTLARKA